MAAQADAEQAIEGANKQIADTYKSTVHPAVIIDRESARAGERLNLNSAEGPFRNAAGLTAVDSPPRRARAPVLGILGGMGPRSTAPFVELVLDACQRQYGAEDDLDYPLLMVCSMPVPFVPQAAVHDTEAEFVAVREGLQRLDTPDAGVLAIACNTAHTHHTRLAASVRAPLLDMVQIATDVLVARSPGRVAVLCSRPTADSGLYTQRLQSAGVQIVVPDWQDEVDALLALTRRRPGVDVLRRAWQSLRAQAHVVGAETVLVACLDLSGVLHASEPADGNPHVIDAARCLADALVARWLALGGGRATTATASTTATFEAGGQHYHFGSDARDHDIGAVHAFIARSYWAAGITQPVMQRALQGSLNFSLWCDTPPGQQLAGFARVITDHATFAYLCDVFIDEAHRGRGLSHRLLQEVQAHPLLQGLRRFVLVTRDAQTLYASHGFQVIVQPQCWMEIVRRDLYQSPETRP